ncbi:MAG: lamin tail domain-containing protein [Candidatus Doudnabacteria bacterium]
MIKRIRYIFFMIAPVCILFFPLLALADADHLVISQVQTTGGPGKTTNDFVEIYNPTSADIDLSGMRLVKRTKTGTTDTSLKSWTDSTIVHPHGFYLWANSSFTDIAATPDVATTGSIADDNGVALRSGAEDTGTIIDSVAWGLAANAFVEASAFASNPAANQSLERMPGADLGNGADTNNNAADFFLQATAHPRNSQSPAVPAITVEPPPAEPPPAEPPPAEPPPPPPPPSPPADDQQQSGGGGQAMPVYSSDILISEFLPNPDGPDAGAEWVELYNNSPADVDLGGWIIDDESADGSIGSSAYTIPAGVSVLAKSYLAIDLPDSAFVLDNTGGDNLRIFWPSKTLFKQVSYNDSAKIDIAYALKTDGIYAWTQFPTKGEPNQFIESSETGITAAAQTLIKINEIFPNPAGPDSGAEWVEVTNNGTEPVYLHNWTLDDGLVGSDIGSSSYKIQSPIVSPGGFAVLVIPAGKFSLNNTSDTVRLFNENNVLIDSVAYENAAEDLSCAFVNGKWVWGDPTPNAANIRSESVPEPQQISILINELFPEPLRKSQQEEFIELFNPGAEDVDLTGFKIADSATSYKLSVTIPASGYLVIPKSESNISLNNTGKETVSLTDPKQVSVAAVEYEDAPPEQSYNLTADGTYAWSVKLTPGAANQIALAAAAVPVKKVNTSSTISEPIRQDRLAVASVDSQSQADSTGIVSGSNEIAAVAAGPVLSYPTPVNTSRQWLWFLAGSFALNLAFCYILVKLMLRNKSL